MRGGLRPNGREDALEGTPRDGAIVRLAGRLSLMLDAFCRRLRRRT
jgi:hypothetical protein